jgi:hypothetical protein
LIIRTLYTRQVLTTREAFDRLTKDRGDAAEEMTT